MAAPRLKHPKLTFGRSRRHRLRRSKTTLHRDRFGYREPRCLSGGNTAVFVTDAGVVIVDTKLAGWGQVILDRVKTVTNKPITTIINTHARRPYGQQRLLRHCSRTIVHENTKTNMARMDAFKGDNAKFCRSAPTGTSCRSGRKRSRSTCIYFGRGHTDGDIRGLSGAPDVHMGDMFPWKDAPFSTGTTAAAV